MAVPMIFLHLPKTGGMSLGNIVDRQYPSGKTFAIRGDNVDEDDENFKALPAQQRNQFDLLRGHMYFGLHEHVSKSMRYFTVLRDPVDRTISHYFYVKRRANHYLHDWLVSENITLHQYVSCAPTTEIENGQLRMIAGTRHPINTTDQTHYERAIQNLENHFALVGLLERFDETVLLAKEVFNWKYPVFYSKINVTEKRPKSADVSPETLEVIRARNSYDVRLYEYARDGFDALLKEKGKAFERSLHRFRYMNRQYNRARLLVGRFR